MIKSLSQEGGGLFGSNSYPNSASDVIAVSQNAPRTNITITERKAAPVTYNNLLDGNNTRPEISTALKQNLSLSPGPFVSGHGVVSKRERVVSGTVLKQNKIIINSIFLIKLLTNVFKTILY